MLNNNETTLYSRHLLLDEIGVSGQEKLKAAKVLVIGAGGLGCPILQYLTAAGLGTIGIIDGDKVSVSNLQRQILFNIDDVGKSKVRSAVNKLKVLNPYVKFNIYEEYLTIDNAIELFKNYDVIVDGSDNFQTRYLCNDAAVITNKPLVFGSIFKFEGQVTVFNYKNGPTYRCLYPTPPKAGSVLACGEVGVIGVLPGIIGCYQANEVIKIICGLDTVLSGKLLTINTLNNQHFVLSYSKNEAINIIKLEDSYEVFCGISKNEQLAISNEQLITMQKSEPVQLIDVRSDKEFELNPIYQEAINIPVDEIENRISELDTSIKTVLFCSSGQRAGVAFEKVKNNSSSKEIYILKQ